MGSVSVYLKFFSFFSPFCLTQSSPKHGSHLDAENKSPQAKLPSGFKMRIPAEISHAGSCEVLLLRNCKMAGENENFDVVVVGSCMTDLVR